MAISEEDLHKITDEKIRQLVADALTREHTEVSSVGYEILDVVDLIDDIELDEVRTASPETIRDELRRCDVAVVRLWCALEELAERLEAEWPPRSAA